MPERPDSRIETAKLFFARGEHVCPFAAVAEVRGEVSYMQAINSDFSLTNGVVNFLKSGKKALVIMLPAGSGSIEEARHRADLYFLAIARVLLKAQNRKISSTELEETIQTQILPYMTRDSKQHVFLSFKNQALYIIYMGPEYKANEAGVPHSRYAPHPMLVMTRHQDVYDAKNEQPRIFGEIRERMRKAMGGIYDASERVLDQKPEIQEL